MKPQLNIVITGGSRGLGGALTHHFAKRGHNVVILSRYSRIPCDVGDPYQVQNAMSKITTPIDIWINNAGQSGGYKTLQHMDNQSIENIIATNLIGPAVCCKEAYKVMRDQPNGGAIFNLSGAGSDGNPTPNYATYGATKAAISQLTKTLQNEWQNTNVTLHTISPGMMFTDLLLQNMDDKTYKMIERMCDAPDTVAKEIVPQIEDVYYHKKKNQYIRYLTIPKIITKLIKPRPS